VISEYYTSLITVNKEDKMSDNNNTERFFIGMIVGAVIGSAIALLYAPQSGRETRALLKEKAEEAKDKAEEIIKEARVRAKKIIDDARGKAAELQEGQGKGE
jgi:gas vesicle protein